MHTQTEYHTEVTTSVIGGRTITIKNLTPILTPEERERRKCEIEQRLYDVFSKYARNQK